MLLFKLIIVLLLIFVVVTLFTALYQLNTSTNDSHKVVKTLSVRIGMSLLIFVLLWVGSYFGLLKPHGLYEGKGATTQTSPQHN